jgi:hypothetical protein
MVGTYGQLVCSSVHLWPLVITGTEILLDCASSINQPPWQTQSQVNFTPSKKSRESDRQKAVKLKPINEFNESHQFNY